MLGECGDHAIHWKSLECSSKHFVNFGSSNSMYYSAEINNLCCNTRSAWMAANNHKSAVYWSLVNDIFRRVSGPNPTHPMWTHHYGITINLPGALLITGVYILMGFAPFSNPIIKPETILKSDHALYFQLFSVQLAMSQGEWGIVPNIMMLTRVPPVYHGNLKTDMYSCIECGCDLVQC